MCMCIMYYVYLNAKVHIYIFVHVYRGMCVYRPSVFVRAERHVYDEGARRESAKNDYYINILIIKCKDDVITTIPAP